MDVETQKTAFATIIGKSTIIINFDSYEPKFWEIMLTK